MTGVDLETMEEVWQQVKRQRKLISKELRGQSAICVIF